MTQSDDGLGNAFSLPTDQHKRRLVTCRPEELHPHPAYARHRFTVPAGKLSSLAAQGERALQEPLFITQDHLILDGYARLELARQRGCNELPCLQFELSENEALLWLLHKHRRSNGLNAFGRILLAQHRFLDITDQEVVFWTKDLRTNKIVKTRYLREEFVRALADHVPDIYRHAIVISVCSRPVQKVRPVQRCFCFSLKTSGVATGD